MRRGRPPRPSFRRSTINRPCNCCSSVSCVMLRLGTVMKTIARLVCGVAGFRKRSVLFRFSADAVVRVEKHDVRAIENAPHARSPRAPLDTQWHRLAMKQWSLRPVHRLLKYSDAAFLQCGEPGMKLMIEQPPRHLVAPFEMSSIWSPSSPGAWRRRAGSSEAATSRSIT